MFLSPKEIILINSGWFYLKEILRNPTLLSLWSSLSILCISSAAPTWSCCLWTLLPPLPTHTHTDIYHIHTTVSVLLPVDLLETNPDPMAPLLQISGSSLQVGTCSAGWLLPTCHTSPPSPEQPPLILSAPLSSHCSQPLSQHSAPTPPSWPPGPLF